MGMFDSIECNYPLPLPLDIIDILSDPYDLEFQTKDLENLLDTYILNDEGELLWIKKEYKWKDDDEAFLKGYMEVIKEEIVPSNFHGILNFYFYETIREDESSNKVKDLSVDYLAKFTNGKIENIEILSYEIRNANERLQNLKELFEKHGKQSKLWYNKYFFYTKIWKFIKWKIILYPINLIKNFFDKLYWFAVKYL